MAKNETLGSRVKFRRELLEFTTFELAKKANIAPATLYRLEKDEISQLKSDALMRLSKTLKTSVDFLLAGSSEPDASDLIRRDKNAMDLLKIYFSLTGSEIQQLREFAEFIRSRFLPYDELFSAFRDLYSSYRRLVQAKVANESDPAYEKAQEIIGKHVIERARREVDFEDKEDLLSKDSDKKSPGFTTKD